MFYFKVEKVQSWNESLKSSRETNSKICMTKFKQCFGTNCFSFMLCVCCQCWSHLHIPV